MIKDKAVPDENRVDLIGEINEVFAEKIKDALAVAMVTREGEVLIHYAAQGRVSKDPADAAYILNMIKELSDGDSSS